MMQKIAVHVAFSIALAIHVLPISVRAAEELSILPNMVWATSLSDPKLELESKGAATTLEGGRIAIAIGYRPKGKLSGRQSIRLDVLDSSGKFEGSVELDRALLGASVPNPRAKIDAIAVTNDGVAYIASAQLNGIVRILGINLFSRQLDVNRDIKLGKLNLEIHAMLRVSGNRVLLLGSADGEGFIGEITKDGMSWRRSFNQQSNVILDGDANDFSTVFVSGYGEGNRQLQLLSGEPRAKAEMVRGASVLGRFPSVARAKTGEIVLAYNRQESGGTQAVIQGFSADMRPAWISSLGPAAPIVSRFRVLPVAQGGYVVAGVVHRRLWVARIKSDGGKIWTYTTKEIPPEYPMYHNVELLSGDEGFVQVANAFIISGGREQRQVVRITKFSVR